MQRLRLAAVVRPERDHHVGVVKMIDERARELGLAQRLLQALSGDAERVDAPLRSWFWWRAPCRRRGEVSDGGGGEAGALRAVLLFARRPLALFYLGSQQL